MMTCLFPCLIVECLTASEMAQFFVKKCMIYIVSDSLTFMGLFGYDVDASELASIPLPGMLAFLFQRSALFLF